MYSLTAIKEGFRFFWRSLKIRKNGFKEYPGDDISICKSIIEECWSDKLGYFRTSTGNHSIFYSRDFSWCAKPLMAIGHRKRVVSTIKYALDRFQKHGRIRIAINRSGIPFDFPTYAVDSVPSVIHTIMLLKNKGIINTYREFLEHEINYLFQSAIEKSTGLVRKDREFSSIKDHAKRNSSCYDNCMIGMLSSDLKYLGLKNPFKKYDYPELIHKNFWNKTYFLDDLSGRTYISSDANTFPFWTGVITDKIIFKQAFETMRGEKLDKPFPLKYHQKSQGPKMGFANHLAPDYETDSIWAHLGMLLIETLVRKDKKHARKYLEKYFEKIIQNKTFLEVYDKEGNPYRSNLYISDEGMLWAAIYLGIVKKLKN